MNTKKYYSKNGTYFKEHKKYLSPKNLKRDTDFIINALKLNKKDKCLDLQCADGRLTIELNKKGYDIDGLDFSPYMISLARANKGNFFLQDLNNINLPKIYTKAFIFFPDWIGIDFEKILPNINRVMKKGGLFLYDHDNLFRLLNYFEKNPKIKSQFVFNPATMIFKRKGDKEGDRYYIYPELEKIFNKNGFKIIAAYGDWTNSSKYNYNSIRLRIIAKKL